MRIPNRISLAAKLAMLLCVCALAFGAAAFAQEPPPPPGDAQGGPPQGPPPMPQEHRDAAWTLEAQSVATSLGLTADQTSKLVEAYKTARESQSTAMRAAREQAQGGGGGFRAMQQTNQAERAKLDATLKTFLSADQTTKALATLGTFNHRWDMMTLALSAMKLDAAVQTKAMDLVANHVAESAKLMETAMAGGDREAMRTQGEALKQKLDTELAKVLTADQMTKWTEQTSRRGGMRGPGGPGGQGSEGRTPPPPPPGD